MLKAAPVEFLGGSRLIRKSEVVRPAFLLCPPAAIPHEVEHARGRARFHFDLTGEIRAARARTEGNPFHRKLWLGGQHVGKNAPHLDRRRVAVHANVLGVAMLAERAHGGLELLRGSGSGEYLLQFGHEAAWRRVGWDGDIRFREADVGNIATGAAKL